MNRLAPVFFVLLASCALPPLKPELSACLSRMEAHAETLRPVFAALGYRPEVRLHLDEDMDDGRGFRQSTSTLGDSLPSGRIRLRPSRLCTDDVLGRAVVAHEMAHVALLHRGVAGSGITLAWEKRPQQEIDADELAYAALTRAGGDTRAAVLVSCWLGKCGGKVRPEGAPPRW
jgi:hypothetical protein